MKSRQAVLTFLAITFAIISLVSGSSEGKESSTLFAEDTAVSAEEDSAFDYSKKQNSSSNYVSQTFTNEYGTASAKCAHSGCDNYIASSGDTNCCTVHSNRCLECGKYIDEDAVYCMSCLSGAISSSTHEQEYSSTKSENTGAGGYDMPMEGETFSNYVQRVDPELYGDLFK